MQQAKPKPLSPITRVLGVAAFGVLIVGSIMIGDWLSPRRGATLVAPATNPILYIAFLILGGVVFVAGLVAYAIVLATHCFTFRFDRPFFGAYRRKMWFVNVVVGLLLQSGFAMMMFPTASRLLAPLL